MSAMRMQLLATARIQRLRQDYTRIFNLFILSAMLAHKYHTRARTLVIQAFIIPCFSEIMIMIYRLRQRLTSGQV